MQLTSVLVFASVALCALAVPMHQTRAPVNRNQGGDRLITQEADGSFQVEGLKFFDESVADQVSCSFDEKDCLASGKSSDECAQVRIGCQSGNGINGQSAKLNGESP